MVHLQKKGIRKKKESRENEKKKRIFFKSSKLYKIATKQETEKQIKM
jgi:hypothetical protein